MALKYGIVLQESTDVESVTAFCMEWNLISKSLKLCCWFSGKEHTIITHRVMLSEASSLFDPLGLASPFAIPIRLVYDLFG